MEKVAAHVILIGLKFKIFQSVLIATHGILNFSTIKMGSKVIPDGCHPINIT